MEICNYCEHQHCPFCGGCHNVECPYELECYDNLEAKVAYYLWANVPGEDRTHPAGVPMEHPTVEALLEL